MSPRNELLMFYPSRTSESLSPLSRHLAFRSADLARAGYPSSTAGPSSSDRPLENGALIDLPPALGIQHPTLVASPGAIVIRTAAIRRERKTFALPLQREGPFDG